MTSKKHFAITAGVVVSLGAVAILLVWISDRGPALRISPPEPKTVPSSTASPVAPITVAAARSSATPAAAAEPREPPVPWEQVDEVSGIRPSDSPHSELAMDLNEQLRGAIQPCSEEAARRYARGITTINEATPSMMKLHLEAPAAGRIVVTEVDPAWIGPSPSEYVKCCVKAVTGYETLATGLPAGHRIKMILQIY